MKQLQAVTALATHDILVQYWDAVRNTNRIQLAKQLSIILCVSLAENAPRP